MQVKEIMTSKPVTCPAHADAGLAAKLMWDGDFGCVPVVEDDGTVVGMITDRDICMAALHEGKPLAEIPIAEVMSKDLLTCHPDDAAISAERLMSDRQVRRLPVVDASGHCIGLLSLNDLASAATGSRRSPDVTESTVARTLAAVGQPRV